MLETEPFWSGQCRSPKMVGRVTRLGTSVSLIPADSAVLQIFSWRLNFNWIPRDNLHLRHITPELHAPELDHPDQGGQGIAASQRGGHRYVATLPVTSFIIQFHNSWLSQKYGAKSVLTFNIRTEIDSAPSHWLISFLFLTSKYGKYSVLVLAASPLTTVGWNPSGCTKAIWAEVETLTTASSKRMFRIIRIQMPVTLSLSSSVDLTLHWRSPMAALTGVPEVRFHYDSVKNENAALITSGNIKPVSVKVTRRLWGLDDLGKKENTKYRTLNCWSVWLMTNILTFNI